MSGPQITARGRAVTLQRSGDAITIRARNPFTRPVRFRAGDVLALYVHQPRGLQGGGWVAFDFGIQLDDPGALSLFRVDYRRSQRREFAALVNAGGWRRLVIA